MNTLSALSGRPVNSGFCVEPPSLVGTRNTSSSTEPTEVSALTIPERLTMGFAVGAQDAGWLRKMSLCTTMRFVPISQSRSHEPAASKIGFVTPAMYPGLWGGQPQAKSGSRGGCAAHTFSHSSRLMRVA